MNLVLTGSNLTIEKLCAASTAEEISIEIGKKAEEKVKEAEKFLKKLAGSGETVYGLNTGFGYFAKTRIKPTEIEQLQTNIIRSHACGVGEELPRDVVLAMWLVLLNSVCRGHRGLALAKLKQIIKGLEAGILACVPARGSVGASGDLAPSAHAVLAALGEGECTMGGRRMKASEALRKAKIAPLKLGPKEGLCLINGTQLTAALAAKAWAQTARLLDAANLAAAMMIEALRASHHLTDAPLLREQRQKGTSVCGAAIAEWLGGSTQISKSHADCDRVQDPYSLRCAPQVHGMVWEELSHAKEIIENEMNSTTDNPLLFAERELVLHGGNFHAIYPARVCDRLSAALATLAAISERRISTAMMPDKSGLPAFLIAEGGLNSGLMMIQTTAAALVSECKSLSFPASVDSIPTSNNQEDHVSMGPGAGLKALKCAELASYVIAIELLVAAQGLDMLKPLKSSAQLEAAKAKIRKKVPYLAEDRILAPDIEAVRQMVVEGKLI
jgi:histidine ammonia-lyase